MNIITLTTLTMFLKVILLNVLFWDPLIQGHPTGNFEKKT